MKEKANQKTETNSEPFSSDENLCPTGPESTPLFGRTFDDGLFCPNCGARLEGRKCKLFCPSPNCGYVVTCSEW